MSPLKELKAPVTIRLAIADDLPEIAAAYREWGYRGGVEEGDHVFMAEDEKRELVGLVRMVEEDGVNILRGMRIPPRQQLRGIGSALLHRAVQSLAGAECFCLPYATLEEFFSSAGFVKITRQAAPPFLVERMVQYQHGGGNFILMHRPAG